MFVSHSRCPDKSGITITIPAALPGSDNEAEVSQLKTDVEASVIAATGLEEADIDFVELEVKSELGIAIAIPAAYGSISRLDELKEDIEATVVRLSTGITNDDIAFVRLSPADGSDGANVVATVVLKASVDVSAAKAAKKTIGDGIADRTVTFIVDGEAVAVVKDPVVEGVWSGLYFQLVALQGPQFFVCLLRRGEHCSDRVLCRWCGLGNCFCGKQRP